MDDKLFEKVINATGLPEDLVTQELAPIILQAGKDMNNMTLDDLRDVLASYVQDVLLELKADLEERGSQ